MEGKGPGEVEGEGPGEGRGRWSAFHTYLFLPGAVSAKPSASPLTGHHCALLVEGVRANRRVKSRVHKLNLPAPKLSKGVIKEAGRAVKLVLKLHCCP